MLIPLLLSLDVIYDVGLGFQFMEPGLHQLVPKRCNFVNLRVVSQIHRLMLPEELDRPLKVLSTIRLVRFHKDNTLLTVGLGWH